jgi:ring-1,2-phenylacetyl-CoA epoxidase subunit PaaE
MLFHRLTIREVRRETPECVSIAFDLPTGEQGAEFRHWTAGQYLTLEANVQGELLRRSYSICSAPHENELRIAVKKVVDGKFSTFANEQLKAGDTIEVMPPQGRFGLPEPSNPAPIYVAFAAGSGITPIIALIKSALQTHPNSRFVLVYGNRSFDHIIFRDQLEYLKNKYPSRISVHHILSRESTGSDLNYGHIDAAKCRQFARFFFQPDRVECYFLCGPEAMILNLKDELSTLGVELKRIKFELFGTGTVTRAKVVTATTTNGFDADITVIQDGAPFEFKLPAESTSSLLDAAMRAGADLPYACKGGVCSTCKARVLEGKISMAVNYGLEPDEIAAGYVLTCQARPETQKVVLSFDH